MTKDVAGNERPLPQAGHPARITKRIQITMPADAPNAAYAIRQLLDQDPEISPRVVIVMDVDLTISQVYRLKNISQDDLLKIRNGVNPTTIHDVRLVDEQAGCDSVYVGFDRAEGPDRSATRECRELPLRMSMTRELTVGIWALQVNRNEVAIHRIEEPKTLDTEIPACLLTAQTGFKVPAQYREPVMPGDYGKTIWWHDNVIEEGKFPAYRSGKLAGEDHNGKTFVIELDKHRTTRVYRSCSFIVDQPAEGF